jgi:hypothetical protein
VIFTHICVTGTQIGVFFLKEEKKIFGKVMGMFLRLIEPLAEAI